REREHVVLIDGAAQFLERHLHARLAAEVGTLLDVGNALEANRLIARCCGRGRREKQQGEERAHQKSMTWKITGTGGGTRGPPDRDRGCARDRRGAPCDRRCSGS